MFSTDAFMDRTFDKDNYNCLHFTRDIWLALKGEDITQRLGSLLTLDTLKRRAIAPGKMGFKVLERPLDPCFVIMQNQQYDSPHIAVHVERRIFHLAETGPQYLPFSAFRNLYRNIRFLI